MEPFLGRHGFTFDNYENGKGSGGLGYQIDNYQVGHTFYLDHLGLADKKQFPGFQSDDKLLAFRHILHDLDFLVDDFFNGSCNKLVEAAQLQDKFIKEHNAKAQEDYKNYFDQMKIDRARKKFKEKDYKGTLDIYMTVEHKTLLKELDKKFIEYCKRNA